MGRVLFPRLILPNGPKLTRKSWISDVGDILKDNIAVAQSENGNYRAGPVADSIYL